ncbi:MAG: bifunctional riboflavin kinase/FAD synthetase [Adhaeribacter sp.]
MKVIRDLANFPVLPHAVVTSGTFDGVHLGHQKIIERLLEITRATNGQSVVVTYWPHPRLVLQAQDQSSLQLLSTIEERIEQLATFPIDYLLIIPFTQEFAGLTSEAYIRKILLATIQTKIFVIGYDHRFGKGREGSFAYLQQHAPAFGFQVEEIPARDIDHVAVSSTKIRKALESGNIATANAYLGRPYSLSGTVVRGRQLGRTIGYPTANIAVNDPHKLIPGQGIYAVKVKVNNQVYGGMLSIGTNPTVGGTEQTIEVNIFSFNQNIYDQELTIYFIAYIREERNLPDLEALKEQLHQDQDSALALLNQTK